jgi:predicted thioesterase
MKPGLQPGAVGELIWNVDSSMVITLGGDPRATVFSTPNMIMLMERSAREALRAYLEPGEESVGTDVQIQHAGGAGIGSVVRGEARVTGIDGKRIHFDVSAWCGDRQLGSGKHTRALVKLDRLIENLEKQSQEGPRAMRLTPNEGTLQGLQTLMVEQSGPVVTVTLNRPRSRRFVSPMGR